MAARKIRQVRRLANNTLQNASCATHIGELFFLLLTDNLRVMVRTQQRLRFQNALRKAGSSTTFSALALIRPLPDGKVFGPAGHEAPAVSGAGKAWPLRADRGPWNSLRRSAASTSNSAICGVELAAAMLPKTKFATITLAPSLDGD